MLSVSVSGFGTWVLPPTKSWATPLWANNTVPCRGTEAREKVKWKAAREIHLFQECHAALKFTWWLLVCTETLELRVVHQSFQITCCITLWSSCLIPKHELATEFCACGRYLCDNNLCIKLYFPQGRGSDVGYFQALFYFLISTNIAALLLKGIKYWKHHSLVVFSLCSSQCLFLVMQIKRRLY